MCAVETPVAQGFAIHHAHGAKRVPYIHVQYSASLEELFDIRAWLADVHQAAVASGLFEPAAIRSFAERRELMIMGDGNPENGFVHIAARIRKGRDEAAQQELAKSILEAASKHLDR